MKQQKNLLTKTLYVIASDRQRLTCQSLQAENITKHTSSKISEKIIPITKLIRRLCV
ncbi:hypothetical protein L3V82_00655 [Thiotrichales bacterium 19S3-7]|nr:hypothetical protein [Thiotrichales bacterium 19S3-7]MCF6800673.1 hypothetical protein [Thiotrichales bacterium 19S3-11]